MNQTLENGKKPSSGPNFDPFDKFGSQFFFLLFVNFTSTRNWTLLQAIIVCNFKEN